MNNSVSDNKKENTIIASMITYDSLKEKFKEFKDSISDYFSQEIFIKPAKIEEKIIANSTEITLVEKNIQ